MRGLPAASVPRLLDTQKDMVDQLRQTLGLDPNLFGSLVLPVLHRYTAFVHLLPASESHHHRGAGGLLRHGLEAAFFAARASEGIVFLPFGTPRERHDLEPRWHVAVALAGLLHDLGKSVADVTVTDRDGRTEWQPYLQTLLEWAIGHDIDRYFLRWNERRHKRHEMYNKMVADRVLTAEIVQWLSQPQPEISRALFETITAANTESVMYRLVGDADRKSVEGDLRANHMPASASLGVPVEKHVLDAMRCLLANGSWTVNQRGERIWVLRDGVYVVWKHAAQEVVRFLDEDRIPGIPRNPDTLADILIERGLATPRVLADGTAYRYWPVSPNALHTPAGEPVVLYMLKLASPGILFSVEPAAVDARIGEEAELPLKRKSTQARGAGVAGAGTVQDEKTVDGVFPGAGARGETNPGETVRNLTNRGDSGVAEHAKDDGVTTESPAAWLKRQGVAGQLLLAMAQDAAANRAGVAGALARVGRTFVVLYPDGVSPYGDPGTIMAALESKGWIAVDPAVPLRKVRELDGVRGLVLTDEPAARLHRLIGAGPEKVPLSASEPYSDANRAAFKEVKSSPEPTASRRKPRRSDSRAVTAAPEQLSLNVREHQPETTIPWPSETDAFVAALTRAIAKREPGIGEVVTTADGRFQLARRDIEALSQRAGIKLARLYLCLQSTVGCSVDAEYIYLQAP